MLTYYHLIQLYGPTAREMGTKYNIEPSLILAIIKAESQGNLFHCIDGRFGVMGVTEEIFKDGPLKHITMLDIYMYPNCNIETGVWWLKQLLNMFPEQEAIRAYSVGIPAIKKSVIAGMKYANLVYKHKAEIEKQGNYAK